jgi:hypothetical protein
VEEGAEKKEEMKLQGYRETFYVFSGKASDINRQLGFAAIAVMWVFKRDIAGHPALPLQLFLPGILVVASLALDLGHYCVGAIVWRSFYRSKEKASTSEDAEIDHSTWLEVPIASLFVGKILCTITAYVVILIFLVRNVGVAAAVEPSYLP